MAAGRYEELTELEVSVRPEQILRVHYPDLGPVVKEVRDTAAAMGAHALEIAKPIAWLRRVSRADIDEARAATLAKALQPDGAGYLFVVTLGPRLDARVFELFEAKDGLEGLFLDSAGWVIAQSALSAVRRTLGARARAEGVRLTRRMGPGYHDWPLEEQSTLVSTLAGGDPLPGIEVLESGAILPEKTFTGFYGLIRE